MQTILVVEDEEKIAQLHKDFLEKSNYVVHIISDGALVVDWVRQQEPDLILLDLMLPNVDGMTLCREIRSFSMVPIIMATARVDDIDRIVGLELGADDYVCKPINPSELVARVRANLRRTVSTVKSDQDSDVVVDVNKYKAWVQEHELELTAIEFQLLTMLVKQPGRIFTRDQIMQAIYSDSRVVSDRTIDSHIKKIRKKLHDVVGDKEYIHSLYGVGFKFEQTE